MARRVSQLDLALAADVSSRHSSCVETGKAQPSRELIGRLAGALNVPMRERNALLMSAGYAPFYGENEIAAPEMTRARRAIELILKQQEPYPAVVVSRHWDVLMANGGTGRLFDWLLGERPADRNAMRMVFDPAILRPLIANWEDVAIDLLRQLHADVAAAPLDPRARALLAQVLAFPTVPPRWRTREAWDAPTEPVWTIIHRKDGREMTFFWTITTFATPQNVTLEELRIECFFPADEATDLFCQELTRS